MKTLLVFNLLVIVTYGRQGFGPGEQDWGYVTVRPDAHKFWWLYETTASVTNITEKPLLIWLQGGPGGSSTGLGNFAEIGPLDADQNPREHTWLKKVNILFIDNPVGSGYSYVDNDAAYATTNLQIANDLITCLREFYNRRPEFLTAPLYIAAQSYGGKMAVDFAYELDKKIKANEISVNLVGVTLIDPWISPIDSVLNWAPFLYNMGIVDQKGYEKIDEGAQKVKAALDAGLYENATLEWELTEYIIIRVASGIDFFNALKKVKPIQLGRAATSRMFKPEGEAPQLTENQKIKALMLGPVKRALNLNVTWQHPSMPVFDYLIADFMKPATDTVEKLLNTTAIKIQVITGQLDLIVDTPGTVQWVDKLKWSGSNSWKEVPRNNILINGMIEGYVKTSGNLSLFWVLRAGHMVPADNPQTMAVIVDNLLS